MTGLWVILGRLIIDFSCWTRGVDWGLTSTLDVLTDPKLWLCWTCRLYNCGLTVGFSSWTRGVDWGLTSILALLGQVVVLTVGSREMFDYLRGGYMVVIS